VHTGLDVLIEERLDILTGKKIGIITNHTGLDRHKNHIVDLLTNRPEFQVASLFSPEHGIRGDQHGTVANGTDTKTGLPLYSLYGSTQKPTDDMLQDIDGLIFDIQDIGARFYTYISTMAHAMEAAAEHGIPFIVLDRPNPITGSTVEGPVLDLALKSFVGIAPMPVRHGMTVGELARMFNGEGWLECSVRCDLTVIPMKGWRRCLWYDETGLLWTKTSPNMPDIESATLYPGLCFLEATNVSEGRGTEVPFRQVGAPWMNASRLMKALKSQTFPGVRFSPVSFTPVDMKGWTKDPMYEGEECHGIRIHVTNRDQLRAVALGIRLLCTIRDTHPDRFGWITGSRRTMELLSGTRWIAQAIEDGEPAEAIVSRWQDELERFRMIRRNYLLYD